MAILGLPANLDQAISGLLVAFRFDWVPTLTASAQANGARVGVVKIPKDGRGLDSSPWVTALHREPFIESTRDMLPDILMSSGAIVVAGVFPVDEMQLAAMLDEHVIQALSFETADEVVAVNVGLGHLEQCPQFRDAAGGGNR